MYVPNRIPESCRFDLLNDQIVGKNKYILVSFPSYGEGAR
jgi:hypothetical protein